MQSIQPAWRRLLHRLVSAGPAFVGLGIGRAGAVAIVTAVAAPLMVVVVGFAADYGYSSYINQRLSRAADSATLGSVSQTAATTAGGYTQTDALQTIGNSIFNASVADLGATGAKFSLSVASDGSGGVVATGSYTYNNPTFFGGLLGINNIPVGGSAKTTARPVTYVTYYILIDTSQSMGIAATQTDMNTLYTKVAAANNGNGCVFACHNLGSGQSVTNQQVARKNNVQLRIDAAKSAISTIISQASSIAGNTKNIAFGIYTIQRDPNTNSLIRTVATPSTDYAALTSAVASVDLGNNNSDGYGDTDYPNELASFNTILTNAKITKNGSGASATSPLNNIILVTDGVTDTFSNSCHWTHCTGPLDASQCTPLKSKATMGVIYTTYAPIWRNNNPSSGQYDDSYNVLVSDFKDQIRPSLQDCTTAMDFFFEANDGPDIIAAVQALFQRTQPSSARITQ